MQVERVEVEVEVYNTVRIGTPVTLAGVAWPLAELCLGEHSRRLTVRTPDGRLAETTGQLLIDFDAEAAPPAVPFARPETRSATIRAI